MSKDSISVEKIDLNSLNNDNLLDNENCLDGGSLSDNEIDTVFYSYPFLLKENYEYQYRITIDGDKFYLDEVKCREDIEDMSTILINEIAILPKDECLDMIQNNINLITFQKFKSFKIGLNDLPIETDFNTNSINEAKEYCLYELQNEIIEN